MWALVVVAVKSRPSIPSQQRWSPRGRPWPRGRPRGHILKSLALVSKVKSLALASSHRKLACPWLKNSTIF